MSIRIARLGLKKKLNLELLVSGSKVAAVEWSVWPAYILCVGLWDRHDRIHWCLDMHRKVTFSCEKWDSKCYLSCGPVEYIFLVGFLLNFIRFVGCFVTEQLQHGGNCLWPNVHLIMLTC